MLEPAGLSVLLSSDTGLGLRSGAVSVVPHNPQWARVYSEVADHVAAALEGLSSAIEHIGSTSVPGLAAKPVLDIAVGARQPIDNDAFIERLQTAGFTFEGDLGIYGGLFFSVASTPDVAVSHLHVVDIDDFQWRWYLTFRNGLRADPALAAAYGDLKQEAAAANEADRDRYNKAKFDWVPKTVSELDEATTDG